MAETRARQRAAAERGSQADRDFATDAQAPGGDVPADGGPLPGETQQEYEASRNGTAEAPGAPQQPAVAHTPWKTLLAQAKASWSASRANTNAMEAVGEHLEVTQLTISPMNGSQYQENCPEKATAFCADGRAYDFYSLAGVEASKALIRVLGTGPWPEAVPFVVILTETSHGDRPLLKPLW